MFGTNKDKAPPVQDKRVYEPEADAGDEGTYSIWRKPQDPNQYSYRAKYIYLEKSKKLQTMFFLINLALGLMVFLGLLYMIIGVDYEIMVMYDGTSLYCIVDAAGNVIPYAPPTAKPTP